MNLLSESEAEARDSSSDVDVGGSRASGAGPSVVPNSPNPEQLDIMRSDLRNVAFWFRDLPDFKKGHELQLEDPTALCTGHAFGQVLHHIDPENFDDAWLERLGNYSPDANIRVKRSALRKLWRQLSNYITITLGCDLRTNRWNHLYENIAGFEEADLPVAIEYCTLIVGVAHFGKTAEKIVRYSSQMSDEKVVCMQTVAKFITTTLEEIPDLQNRKDDVGSGQSKERSSDTDDTSLLTNGDSNEHVDKRVEELQRERNKMANELDALRSKLKDFESGDAGLAAIDSHAFKSLEKHNQELKMKNREIEGKNVELEYQLEAMRPALQELTKENSFLKDEVRDLATLRQQLQTTLDELDYCREQADRSKIDSDSKKQFEKQLKERDDRIKVLKSRLDHYIERSTNDDENRTAIINLQQAIGAMRGELEKKGIELISEKSRVQKLENDLIEIKHKFSLLETRKEELTAERDQLQDELIKSRDSLAEGEKSLHDSLNGIGSPNSSFDSTEKQKLEVENKRLLERIEELEGFEALKGEVSVLKNQNLQLEQTVQIVEKKKDDLTTELAELKKSVDSKQKGAQGDVVELKIQLEQVAINERTARDAAEKAEKRVQEVEAMLTDKTAEVEKLVRALNGAKVVINDIEQFKRDVGDDSGMSSVEYFRQLQTDNEQKDKRIRQLEDELERSKRMQEEETRLLATGFHASVHDRNRDAMIPSSESPPRRTASAAGGGGGGTPSSTSGNNESSSTTSTPQASFLNRQKMHNALAWSWKHSVAFLVTFALICMCTVFLVNERPPPTS